MSSFIYHIAKSDAWERESRGGEYRHPSLETEGFIHCSLAEQVPETLEKFFPSRDGLVLLEIEVERLVSELRYENGFPHIYGPLNVEAVVAVRQPPQIKKNPE
jgi:uncharacterized protein (DUF952 family)